MRTFAAATFLPRLAVMLVLVGAVEAVRAEPEGASCGAAVAQEIPLTDREGALSRFEHLPEHCLKALFHYCAVVAGREMLDGGSAARCSVGYEALLRRSFRGDFHALLAWWRSERGMRP